MSIIDTIFSEMMSDDEDWFNQSERLINIYENASEEIKEKIDDVLVCVCGWTMATLIEKTS